MLIDSDRCFAMFFAHFFVWDTIIFRVKIVCFDLAGLIMVVVLVHRCKSFLFRPRRRASSRRVRPSSKSPSRQLGAAGGLGDPGMRVGCCWCFLVVSEHVSRKTERTTAGGCG